MILTLILTPTQVGNYVLAFTASEK